MLMNPTTLLESRKFRVERRFAPGRDGQSVAYDVVAHPGAAVILPVLDDGRVLLIEIFRPAIGQVQIELPAGTIEPPEPPIACAKRELEEETGYRAAAWSPLLRYYPSPGILDEEMHVFVARELERGSPRPAADERIAPRPMEPAALRMAMRDGTLRDGKTLLSLWMYFNR